MAHRLAIIVGLLLATSLALACGDDDGGGDGSPTPFIAPATLAADDAIAELDEIMAQVNDPDQELVDAAGIGEFELETRIEDAIEGTAQVPGLNEARQLLEDGDRILAREYVHNNLVETLAIPFTKSDTESISADALETLDPLRAFAERGEDLPVSAIFRDVAVRLIQLWYQI